eukprot:symbB.v1.2.026762.t1/scaffold2700.1/size72752/7
MDPSDDIRTSGRH